MKGANAVRAIAIVLLACLLPAGCGEDEGRADPEPPSTTEKTTTTPPDDDDDDPPPPVEPATLTVTYEDEEGQGYLYRVTAETPELEVNFADAPPGKKLVTVLGTLKVENVTPGGRNAPRPDAGVTGDFLGVILVARDPTSGNQPGVLYSSSNMGCQAWDPDAGPNMGEPIPAGGSVTYQIYLSDLCQAEVPEAVDLDTFYWSLLQRDLPSPPAWASSDGSPVPPGLDDLR